MNAYLELLPAVDVKGGQAVQQPLLLLRGRRDVRHEVDEQPIVRHVMRQVRMGPVRAPQHPVGELLHHTPRKRTDVRIVRLWTGNWQDYTSNARYLETLREGARLRVRVASPGYDPARGGPAVADWAVLTLDVPLGAQAQRVGPTPDREAEVEVHRVVHGIELALGRGPDVAINHSAAALALHAANHPETLHLDHRQPFNVRNLMQGYWSLGASPRFLLLALASGIPFNGMFLYVLSAPAFLGELLGLPRSPSSPAEDWVEYEAGNVTLAVMTPHTHDYEFAPLRIPPGTSRSAAATMLSLQADVGGWELARLQLHPDGTRKVVLRRRARLSYLPQPVT